MSMPDRSKRNRLSSSRSSRFGAPLLGVLLAGVVATSALADDNELLATKTFEDAKAARDSGDWKKACDLFDKSQKASASFGALYNLGECNDHLGNFATAWTSYKAAVSFARRSNDKRGDDADAKAKALEPKLSMLTVVSSHPVPGLVVKRDGVDVTNTVGVELPIDPGKHTIEASAPGYKTATVEVTIGTSAEKKSQEVPELTKDASGAGGDNATGGASPTGSGGASPTGSGGAGGSESTGTGGADAGPSKGMPGVMIGGLVVGGVGAAGLLLGAIMGGVAIGAKGDVEAACPNSTCSTQEGKDALSTAKTDATVSTIGFIAGGVLAAGGAVMIIVGAVSGKKSSDKPAAALYVVPEVNPYGAGALFGGSF